MAKEAFKLDAKISYKVISYQKSCIQKESSFKLKAREILKRIPMLLNNSMLIQEQLTKFT